MLRSTPWFCAQPQAGARAGASFLEFDNTNVVFGRKTEMERKAAAVRNYCDSLCATSSAAPHSAHTDAAHVKRAAGSSALSDTHRMESKASRARAGQGLLFSGMMGIGGVQLIEATTATP